MGEPRFAFRQEDGGTVVLARRGDGRGEWGDPGTEYVLTVEEARELHRELTAIVAPPWRPEVRSAGGWTTWVDGNGVAHVERDDG